MKGTPRKMSATALIELAGQPSVGHVELEQAMAGRQGHVLDLGQIPGADDQPARIGIALADLLQQGGDLVDGAAVRVPRPGTPLDPVRSAPDRPFSSAHSSQIETPNFLQIGDVAVTAQKPQELVDDRSQMQAFGGDQRETLRPGRSASGNRTGSGLPVPVRSSLRTPSSRT